MSTNNPSISIIVPCYNCISYIEKCISSFENQTCNDFEVVFIDDCSTDDTYTQLLKLLENKIFEKKIIRLNSNSGPGNARRKGIELANGKYLAFCDSDDWYDNDCVQHLIDKISENSPDVIMFEHNKVFGEKAKYIKTIPECGYVDINDAIANCMLSFSLLCIKKTIAESIGIADMYNGEDYATIPLWLQKCSTFSTLSKPLYNYYMRNNSASRMPSHEAMYNLFASFEYTYERMNKEYLEAIEYIGIKNCIYGVSLVGLKAGNDDADIIDLVHKFTKMFPAWKKNIYIKNLSLLKRCYIYSLGKESLLFAKIYVIAHKLVLTCLK